MKKDNFDLRAYLVENKMTENSRGDVRYRLGKTILDTRILKEMRMFADPFDHHDPDYDEDYYANRMPEEPVDEGYGSSRNNWEPVYDGGYNSYVVYAAKEPAEKINAQYPVEQYAAVPFIPETDNDLLENVPEDTRAIVFDLDEQSQSMMDTAGVKCTNLAELGKKLRACKSYEEAVNSPIWDDNSIWADTHGEEDPEDLDECGPELNANVPLDEAGSSYPKAQQWLSQHPNVEVIRDITSVVDPEEDQDYVTTATEAGYAFISELEAMLSSGQYDDDFIESACENGVIDDPKFNPPASEFNYGSNSIDEASYTDDDEDGWADDDLDLDDRGGASLLDLVGKDRGASRARKVAAKDTAEDPAMDDEPVDTDAPEIDDPDAENAAGASDPNAEAQPGLSAQVKYNPNTVEMMMDDQELDQYLSGFRRPQVAVNVLNRAIRTAQDEVNDSIGLNHLYIVLENGFYVTSRSQRGQVIAKVSADQAWRKKKFGQD